MEDNKKYDRGLREAFEAMGTLYTAPPMMVIVCNNTTISYEVYREIAGCQDVVNEDFDGDHSGNKEAKLHYLKDYWIPADNNLKTYGEWYLLDVRDVDKLEEDILKAI